MTAPPALVPRSLARAALSALLVLLIEAALLALGLGGVPALLAAPRALALLVVWGVTGLVLATLRPVRGQDVAERLPRQGLMLVVLLVVPLFTPMACGWAARAGLWPLPGGAALGWGGVALAAAGLALRITAMVRLGDRFAPVVALQREHVLEIRGPYGHLRHPGYLGAWLANLGAVLALGSAAGLASVALFTLALDVRMRHEEALLARRFGPEWTAYAARAGRWWPWPGSRLARP